MLKAAFSTVCCALNFVYLPYVFPYGFSWNYRTAGLEGTLKNTEPQIGKVGRAVPVPAPAARDATGPQSHMQSALGASSAHSSTRLGLGLPPRLSQPGHPQL